VNQPQKQPAAPAAPQEQTQPESDFMRLLKKKVDRIDAEMTRREPEIEKLLPNFMKGQAKRLIARARQSFARGGTLLHKCSEASFLKCVLEAAELGFAIDGKMVHAVPYNCKLKGPDGKELKENGKPVWGYEAQLIPDYKGLIAVAKRSGIIQDCWARVIYDSDEFTYVEEDGKVKYRHVPDFQRERDGLDGATCVLAVATHKDGWFRTEVMPIADVLKIRGRSKSYKGEESFTPWNSDPAEMSKKTSIKRLLKTFSDDPGLIRIMELDERDFREESEDEPSAPSAAMEETKRDLDAMLAGDVGKRQPHARKTTAPPTAQKPAPQETAKPAPQTTVQEPPPEEQTSDEPPPEESEASQNGNGTPQAEEQPSNGHANGANNSEEDSPAVAEFNTLLNMIDQSRSQADISTVNHDMLRLWNEGMLTEDQRDQVVFRCNTKLQQIRAQLRSGPRR
jgi:recombination protein RecT